MFENKNFIKSNNNKSINNSDNKNNINNINNDDNNIPKKISKIEDIYENIKINKNKKKKTFIEFKL